MTEAGKREVTLVSRGRGRVEDGGVRQVVIGEDCGRKRTGQRMCWGMKAV